MTGCHSKRLFVLFLFLGNQVCRIVGQGRLHPKLTRVGGLIQILKTLRVWVFLLYLGLIIVTPVPAIVTPGQCQCTPATNCADGGSAVDPRVLNNVHNFSWEMDRSQQWFNKLIIFLPVCDAFQPAFPVCTPPNRFCCNLISTTPPIVVTPPTCGTQPLIPFPAYTVGAGQVGLWNLSTTQTSHITYLYKFCPQQASYSEYPWMVVVLGTDNSYIGGGMYIWRLNKYVSFYNTASDKPS